MSFISNFLNAYLENINRFKNLKNGLSYTEKAYQISTGTFNSKYILISYLFKFPLFSYKFKSSLVFSDLIKHFIQKDYRNSTGFSILSS